MVSSQQSQNVTEVDSAINYLPCCEEESAMEGEEEARPDDTGEDEGDSGDEGSAGPVQKPRKKRKKKTLIEPDSDDDPDPSPVYQEDQCFRRGRLDENS